MGLGDQAPGEALSLLGQLEQADRDIRRFRALSEDTTGTAQSPDGLIEATVGLYGDLRELILDPRVLRAPNAAVLADQLREVVNEAGREAQQAAAAQLSSLFPHGTDDPADLAYEPFLAQITKIRKGTQT